MSLRLGTSHKLMRCLVLVEDALAKLLKCHTLASLLNSPMMVDCEQIGGLRKVQDTTADTAKIRIALGSFGISSSANRLTRAAFAIVQLGRP